MKQLKHLPRFLSAKEARTAKLLLAVAVISALALVGRYAAAHISETPARGGDYIEASVGGPRFVNPVLAANNDVDSDLIKLVYSGLMTYDDQGHLVPDLAKSYTVSQDGKTYTFKLRDGVQWQDGTDFSANDVVATVSYIKDPAWQSPLAAQFKDVTVTAPDQKTVVFTLQEPFAPFLSMLTVGILPEHLWQDIQPENAARAELNVKPVGTGPFRFKNFTKDSKGVIRSYTVVRNDLYYGKKPYLNTVTLSFYSDFSSAKDAFVQRKVDGVSFLPLQFRADVQKMHAAVVRTPRMPEYTAIFFNQSKNDALTDTSVRQALAMAIDKDALVKDVLGDTANPVHGPILPGYVGFYPGIKKYPYDPSAAGDLLDKAGWKKGDDGMRSKTVKNGKNDTQEPLHITLTTVDTQVNRAVAQEIQKRWEAIGVKTDLRIIPAELIQKQAIRPRDYEALLYGEIVGPDPDPYPFWHSSQNKAPGLNLAVFSSRKVDSLLEQARATTDDKKRADLYDQFQDILAQDVPAIFLYSPTYTYAMSTKVKGVDVQTIYSPADRFSDVQDWYMKTAPTWK